MTCAVRESTILDAIRLVAAEVGVVVWRNNTGLATEGARRVPYGLTRGSSDFIGMLVPEGRFLAVEVKSARGRLTEDQRLFLELVRRSGGVGAVVRSVAEFRAAVARARAGGDR